MTELQTNANRQGQTDADGYFEIPTLNPGKYEVQVEHTGFKRFVQRGIQLETSGRVRVDVNLEVGETTTEVTVTGDVPPIETETARIGTIQSQAVFQYLPMAANRVALQPLRHHSGRPVGGRVPTYSIGREPWRQRLHHRRN